MNHLLAEIKAGSQNAFYKVYEEYHSKLYQYIYKYTQSVYLAEETVQITFIKLWEKRDSLSEECTISSQIFRIAKSTVSDLMRKEKIRDTQELSETFVSNTATADIIFKDELSHVIMAIDTLPEQSQRVFKLSRFDQLSHKQISNQLLISPKTIENHISKAIKHLKKSLVTLL